MYVYEFRYTLAWPSFLQCILSGLLDWVISGKEVPRETPVDTSPSRTGELSSPRRREAKALQLTPVEYINTTRSDWPIGRLAPFLT